MFRLFKSQRDDGTLEPESTIRNLGRSEQVEDQAGQMNKMGQAEQTTTQAEHALNVRPGGMWPFLPEKISWRSYNN